MSQRKRRGYPELNYHTLFDVARLRKAGLAWEDIAGSFGLPILRGAQEPQTVAHRCWQRVGAPGCPASPDNTSFYPSLPNDWDTWGHERDRALDAWLISLIPPSDVAAEQKLPGWEEEQDAPEN